MTGAERLSLRPKRHPERTQIQGAGTAPFFDSYQNHPFFDVSCVWQTYFGDGFSTCFIRRSSRLEKSTGGGSFRQRRQLRIAPIWTAAAGYPAARQNSVYGENDRVIFGDRLNGGSTSALHQKTFRDNRIDTADTRSGHSARNRYSKTNHALRPPRFEVHHDVRRQRHRQQHPVGHVRQFDRRDAPASQRILVHGEDACAPATTTSVKGRLLRPGGEDRFTTSLLNRPNRSSTMRTTSHGTILRQSPGNGSFRCWS